MGQPAHEIRAAIDYYADYPHEIEARLRLSDEEQERLRRTSERRHLLTENARDLIPLAQAALERGDHHPGLVVTPNRSLPRHRGGGIGPLVTALARLAGESRDLRDRIEWLAP